MAGEFMSIEYSWVSIELTYEGFPLFLRRSVNLDTDSLQALFSNLAVLTHKFSKREPNGLPEADYNDSLFDFDREIVGAMNSDGKGVPVLIETFGGKRNYYFYVAADANVEELFLAISRRHPNKKLTWSVRPDATWSFIKKYTKEFF